MRSTPPGAEAPTARFGAGPLAALASAALFGCSVPLAKELLAQTGPWLLAALLYLGSGVGLLLVRTLSGAAPVRLPRREWGWLAAALAAGGMAGPVLLMLGLAAMPASGAALLLTAEAPFTALLAWFVFGEGFDRRIALGMAAIAAGALVLAWPGEARFAGPLPALAVLGACLTWGLDNNLTRKVSSADASFVAMAKGLVAGSANLALALAAGASPPSPTVVAQAAALGFVSYGASLALFVIALRRVGAARAGAYFAVAPFFGAALAILVVGEPLTARLVAAGALMAVGVWLHLTEWHMHEHTHEAVEHSHEHVHDAHHRHEHDAPVTPGTRHTHRHRHEPLTHTHAHFPDTHHGHRH